MTGRGNFPRQMQSVPVGTQLNNMFEIDALVTAGGMGEVYRGHNIQTHDPVAIKIVLPEFAQDDLILQLFRKEARILNHLHHEAIVRYYVFSIDATLGLPFLVMEFVDGPSLAERIKAGPLDAAAISTLQQHLAEGLETAHRAGVIHRDIAPDNIILPDGRVDLAKLIDFGIARSAIAGVGTLLGGQFAGKYNFVSPEQLGLFDGEVTNRSDIYSLGLVLGACALGRPLDMSGSQVEVIEKRRSVPDLSGIEPPLRGLLEAMLQPDPKDRPQSMAEVAAWPTFEAPAPDAEKTRVYTTPPRAAARQASQPPTAPPPIAPDPTPRPAERQRDRKKSRAGLIASAVALLAVLVAMLGGWLYVEHWSGTWYEASAVIAEDPAPPVEEEIAPETTAPIEPAAPPEPPEPPAPVEPTEPVAPPEPVEPTAPTFTASDIRDHVTGHDGGDCYFAFPADIGDSHAEIIGYGNDRKPFDALGDSVRARFGFEPAIEVRRVSDDQCPMVAALSELATAGAARVEIDLSHTLVRSGGALGGTVTGLGERHLAMVMLDNFGFVHSLEEYVNRNGDTARFEVDEMTSASEMDEQPQLVLSIASSEPLESLDLTRSLPVSELLPAVLEEVADKPDGLATGVGHFLFGS